MTSLKKTNQPFFKSVAISLLFCVFLGPLGVLYASVRLSIILLILSFFIVRAKLWPLFIFVWIISCILGVVATNRYNNALARSL